MTAALPGWMPTYSTHKDLPACQFFLKKYVYNKIKILAYKQA